MKLAFLSVKNTQVYQTIMLNKFGQGQTFLLVPSGLVPWINKLEILSVTNTLAYYKNVPQNV
jgi:hypothetical protein